MIINTLSTYIEFSSIYNIYYRNESKELYPRFNIAVSLHINEQILYSKNVPSPAK